MYDGYIEILKMAKKKKNNWNELMHNNKRIIKLNYGETARNKYFCQKNISWNGKCSRYNVKF